MLQGCSVLLGALAGWGQCWCISLCFLHRLVPRFPHRSQDKLGGWGIHPKPVVREQHWAHVTALAVWGQEGFLVLSCRTVSLYKQ